MYTENNNGGLIKNIVLKLLFVALFIFLLLWLYPMPNTKPFYDAIFNNNINLMKEVAEDYYTVQRLPEKIGETNKLTLKEMLDKKLLLPFVDKNGEYCDVEKSFVQVTKLENDEYELKVTLSCKGQTDYIIEYLGCHDLCKNGECQKVVEVLEYKFERTLLKGRKKVNVNAYKYEYTKNESEAYTVDNLVTYYKGRKLVSEDTYKYKYTKEVKTANEKTINTTYYKGRKQVTNTIYEYTKTTTTTSKVPVTKQEDPICKTYYNQSSAPSSAVNVKTNQGTIEVDAGYYGYTPWVTINSYTSSTPCASGASSTYRTISDGYSISTGNCKTGDCPKSTITYSCITQSRDEVPIKVKKTVTTYTYDICTPGKTITTYEEKTSTDTQTTWSATNPGEGWVATGRSKTEFVKYDYTDWVTKLPAGYEQIDKKVESKKVVDYTTETKVEWSTEDLTKDGWTKTEEKEIVKAKEYAYTGWVTVLPAGYEQTDKKQVTEKIVKYRTITKTEWSTEDLTKSGWTRTGKSEKVGSAEKYVYTDWVTQLPAGYEQIDKKVETKWSTETTLAGWTKTNDTRVKEDK